MDWFLCDRELRHRRIKDVADVVHLLSAAPVDFGQVSSVFYPVGKHLFKADINPCSANVPFLYPLKTSENQRFSDVFKGYRKGTLA